MQEEAPPVESKNNGRHKHVGCAINHEYEHAGQQNGQGKKNEGPKGERKPHFMGGRSTGCLGM